MMPFCHAPARNPSGIHSNCLLLATCLCGFLALDAVKVMDTADIPCYEACDGDVSWVFTTKNENLDVLQCVQGKCTEGESFKNRVSLAGNLSLKLYPALYNDEGWYKVLCDSQLLCSFHLEVFVPTTVNATIRGNVTLPCYARTEKQIADDAVNILWKKDDQMVLEVQKGITKYGSGFTGRASVSLHLYKDGDLSLTIFSLRTSDKGLYQCDHSVEEEHGHPGAVTLHVTALQKFYAKKHDDNLTLDLFGSDPVTVSFTGSAETLVCSVMRNNLTCSPEYANRVSVINGSLVLDRLTSSDTGTFTVKEKTGEVISINMVTVEGVTQWHHYMTLLVLPVFVAVCLFLWCMCHRKSQVPEAPCCFRAEESTVTTAPSREPACIGLSQQETSPNILESDVYTNPPIEESMPMMTTEKQDSTEEEVCGTSVWNSPGM